MKPTLLRGVMVLLIALSLARLEVWAAGRKEEWMEVELALREERPVSALEELRRIEAGARAEGVWHEAVEAVMRRVVTEARMAGDDDETALLRLSDRAVAEGTAEMRPLLRAFAAVNWSRWSREKRWELMDRTEVAGGGGDDVMLWGWGRVMAECGRRFEAALVEREVLRGTPIGRWDRVLPGGGLPDRYEPTLYDFVLRAARGHWELLAAAEAGAAGLVRGVGTPALGDEREFLAWKPGGDDGWVRMVRLFQEALRFHGGDADPGARVLLDVDRLAWAGGEAGREGMGEWKRQLRGLLERWGGHEVSVRVAEALGEMLVNDEEPGEAHAVVSGALAKHPGSVFAAGCRNMLKNIETKGLSASTENVWPSGGAEVVVRATNLSRVHFRLILVGRRLDPMEMSGVLEEQAMGRLMRKTAAKAWAWDLPKAGDYREHEYRVAAPGGLKPGFYVLVVSGDANFRGRKNGVVYLPVVVSRLALMHRAVARDGGTAVDAWVVDGESGEPVAGAEVALWGEGKGEEKPRVEVKGVTDGDGHVRLAVAERPSFGLIAWHEGEMAVSEEDEVTAEVEAETVKTYFFTDRAIYRPGQTIQFKGIHARRDAERGEYGVLAGVKREVVLRDANEREVAKVAVESNAFGSFSGSVTAPRQGVTGEMTLGDGAGSVTVQVEEYKRPKFRVEVGMPEAGARLGGEVEVKVRATGYSGAAVDGAKVVWRVRREVEWAPWVSRVVRSGGGSGAGEVGRGETVTGVDGSVAVRFVAVPWEMEREGGDAWFRYEVTADVTDGAGETRSAEVSVRVGERAMQAGLEMGAWQTRDEPVAVRVTTRSLDGEPLAAKGEVEVFRLVMPERVVRPRLAGESGEEGLEMEGWARGERVVRRDAVTDARGETTLKVKLGAGAYRVVYGGNDRFGKEVRAEADVVVVDPGAERFGVRVPYWRGAPSWELQPGEELRALWGSGYDRVRALVEIEHRGEVVERFWTDPARSQQGIRYRITEAHRGGLNVRISQVRERRMVSEVIPVRVPWRNKELVVKWEHMTSKLKPGATDTWSLTIGGAGAERAAVEMAAVLYDGSLESMKEHRWVEAFDGFRREPEAGPMGMRHAFEELETLVDDWDPDLEPDRTWRREWVVRAEFEGSGELYGMSGVNSKVTRGLRFGRDAISRDAVDGLLAAPAPVMAVGGASAYVSPAAEAEGGEKAVSDGGGPVAGITARKNFQETAFFQPVVMSGADGTVKLTFTMPESVTAWRFLGFAHDRKLRSGLVSGETVTARDLMVQANPPRFLREGDEVEMAVKVTNQSEREQSGTARLSFADGESGAAADAALGLTVSEQTFTVPAKESRSLTWRVRVPDGQGFLTWKAVAGTTEVSDGEEGWLPVLSRRVLVTESLPLGMGGVGEKAYVFEKLAAGGGSETLRHQGLSVELTSRPGWAAVMALPYLMEFPHECAEQIFNRYYANALARHLALSDPEIRRVFDVWRDVQVDALESPLLKNGDLKAVLMEETPWMREAAKESEQRRNAGELFDASRLDAETAGVLAKLEGLQLKGGSWPWFAGGGTNERITLYVLAGFGKLERLGIKVESEMIDEAVEWADEWLEREHREAVRADRKEKGDRLTDLVALWLYGRSGLKEGRPVADESRKALEYFLGQARTKWMKKPRMVQAQAAIGMKRFGDAEGARLVLASLRERSVYREETGRYWAEKRELWRWEEAPVETQAMMVEAFREIGGDEERAGECEQWLLGQKRTHSWPTTKATADAVHAVMGGGKAGWSGGGTAKVRVGSREVVPERREAGSGYFRERIPAAEITGESARVVLKQTAAGSAWGAVHWVYLEDAEKVTAAAAGGPLTVRKQLLVRVAGEKGPELRAVAGKVRVGDEVVVRVEVRSDRELEFVHLKDERPASCEPTGVLSGWREQGGVGYYESTRDTAVHYFIETLPKGVHVFEYSVRVQQRGACRSGLATVESLYAPEFRSHGVAGVLKAE
ncbi:MAG: putative conserved protein YfaS, alpha-2-macroglobulin family [Verrucomicrobia bacterium]|nr:MAG: putative conserved protein YfaS, alpha-2-macroglobulin family [Verrucomicrobiota bacterium]